MYVKRFRLVAGFANAIVLNLLCFSAFASGDWQSESRAAYLLLVDGASDSAFERFRTARSMFQGAASNPIALDLEINMAEALIRANRLNEAKAILNRLNPLVLGHFRGTLLEARYWRRCVKFHVAQKSLAEAVEAQKHVLRLVGRNLGDE